MFFARLYKILNTCIIDKLALLGLEKCSKNVFGSVVIVAFQITFRVKIHANDIFLFFKNYF